MLWDAEQSDRHPSRSLGTCRASPVALSRRAENGHVLRRRTKKKSIFGGARHTVAFICCLHLPSTAAAQTAFPRTPVEGRALCTPA